MSDKRASLHVITDENKAAIPGGSFAIDTQPASSSLPEEPQNSIPVGGATSDNWLDRPAAIEPAVALVASQEPTPHAVTPPAESAPAAVPIAPAAESVVPTPAQPIQAVMSHSVSPDTAELSPLPATPEALPAPQPPLPVSTAAHQEAVSVIPAVAQQPLQEIFGGQANAVEPAAAPANPIVAPEIGLNIAEPPAAPPPAPAPAEVSVMPIAPPAVSIEAAPLPIAVPATVEASAVPIPAAENVVAVPSSESLSREPVSAPAAVPHLENTPPTPEMLAPIEAANITASTEGLETENQNPTVAPNPVQAAVTSEAAAAVADDEPSQSTSAAATHKPSIGGLVRGLFGLGQPGADAFKKAHDHKQSQKSEPQSQS